MSKLLAIVCFTESGIAQCDRIKNAIEKINQEDGENWQVSSVHKPESLKKWCEESFKSCDAIIFVCAMGIAIRTIAPFVASKLSDPAVIVMDDMGKNIISVLSGHIGGANELTARLAVELGAHPVITTASDVRGRVAVDSWAIKNDLIITDMICAKGAASAVVAGEQLPIYCQGQVTGDIPPEFVLINDVTEPKNYSKWCIIISDKIISTNVEDLREKKILWLIPRNNVLGVGCKRGKEKADIESAVKDVLARNRIDMRSIANMTSIDVKADEIGLNEFARENNLQISFYSAEQLETVKGNFESSSFVLKTVGIDNVCERSAVFSIMENDAESSRENNIVIPKQKCDGVTVAVARKKWGIQF